MTGYDDYGNRVDSMAAFMTGITDHVADMWRVAKIVF